MTWNDFKYCFILYPTINKQTLNKFRNYNNEIKNGWFRFVSVRKKYV